MNHFAKAATGALTVSLLTVLSVNAHAATAKVPVVYQSGEEIFVAGDGSLPKPFDADPQLAGAQAGYKCDVLGVFWTYLSVSDCVPVAFQGDSFWEGDELGPAIAAAHPESEMNVGLWGSYGKFLLGLGLLAAGGLFVKQKLSGSDDDAEEEAQNG